MRIVSLFPGATEMICAIGLREHLVAVSHECDYPSSVQSLPRLTRSAVDLSNDLEQSRIDQIVSNAMRDGKMLFEVDSQDISKLEPDLIVTQSICEACAVTLDTNGEWTELSIPNGEDKVVHLSGTNFAGILSDLQQLGERTGRQQAAIELCEQLQTRWSQLACHSTDLSAFVFEWIDPPFAPGHWIPEMVSQAGGKNVMGAAGEKSFKTTWPEIQQADPDLILVASCGYGLSDNIKFMQGLAMTSEAMQLRAFQNHNAYAVDANSHFSRQGPRVVDGAEVISEILHRPKMALLAKHYSRIV